MGGTAWADMTLALLAGWMAGRWPLEGVKGWLARLAGLLAAHTPAGPSGRAPGCGPPSLGLRLALGPAQPAPVGLGGLAPDVHRAFASAGLMDPRQRPLLHRRLGVFKALAWSLVAMLILIYAWLQLVRHGEFKQLAMQQAVKMRPIAAPRGLVLDRNGHRLVDNRRALHLVIQREDLPTRPEVIESLALALELEPAALARKIQSYRFAGKGRPAGAEGEPGRRGHRPGGAGPGPLPLPQRGCGAPAGLPRRRAGGPRAGLRGGGG